VDLSRTAELKIRFVIAGLSSNSRHPEVLGVLHGEPRRIGHERPGPSFETPRKRAAPQDEG
jgi:hypothetical protein